MKVKKKTSGKKKTNKSIDQSEDILVAVEKKYGKGSVMRGSGQGCTIKKADVISTGSSLIDEALVIGGLPSGRIVEIYGPEMSGKTTLALCTSAQAQKQGFQCAFIDAEHALSPDLVEGTGGSFKDLVISQPAYGEQGLDIALMLCESGQFRIIIVDSVAALTPKAEIEGDMEDMQVGLQARMMGKGLRKIVKMASSTNTMVIFINQLRMKVGMVFGSPETTPGGKALKFFSSVRLDVRRIGALKQKDVVIGNRLKVTVTKNKLAPPFRKTETSLYFGKGFDPATELFDLALDQGVIEKRGSIYLFEDEKIEKGKDNVIEAIRQDNVLRKTIKQALRAN